MRLIADGTNEEVINITVKIDIGGDAVIKANDVEVCWVTIKGNLLLNKSNTQKLRELGFKMYGTRVDIENL